MKIPLDQFDILEGDFDALDRDIPTFLFAKLLTYVDNLNEIKESPYNEFNIEVRLRAILNKLVHESLSKTDNIDQTKERAISYFLPRMTEICTAEHKGLQLALIEKQLIVLSPVVDNEYDISSFITKLNGLISKSHGAKTWILDLSLVNVVSFELLGYLVGLKLELSKLQIELDLLWLKKIAVPEPLLESIKDNFNLFCKGTFLISR